MANIKELYMEYKRRKLNYQPNIITRSKQQFSLQEQKIVAFIINQIDHKTTILPEQEWVFEIPLASLLEHMTRVELKKAASDINEKRLWIEGDNESWQVITPFPSVEYDSEKRIVRVIMSSQIIPFFVELGKQYTKYHFNIFLLFESVYSQRFYQMLMMYIGRKQKTFTYNVANLQGVLNCEYPNFKDFRRRVLDVAQREISEKASLNFTYTPSKKEGKKIIELEFNILSDVEKNAQISENVYSWVNDFHKFSEFEQVSMVKQLLENQYLFSKKQRDEIMYKIDLRHEFIKLHVEIQEGKHKIEKSPTAFIAACLGFNKRKC
jgi:plasmid replication initiation protein